MVTKTRKQSQKKVCNVCGALNAQNAKQCQECESSKFAPSWVSAKIPINRQVSVQITSSNPQFGESQKRITLSKWWPGGGTSFHIPNLSQWEKLAAIINDELAPLLGWKTARKIVEEIESEGHSGRKRTKKLEELAIGHPDFLKELVAAIDPKKLAKSDFNNLLETFGEISDALTNANAGFREAFLSVIKKLPKQRQRALEDLDLLLEGWSLHVITNVAQQVRARIDTIYLFEKQIQDSRTFEIKGDNSIHRILERAMWLIDERYWLLYSNTTLRKSIGNEMSRKDKQKYGKQRPDFVCGTIGNKLIILELKRPSHTLAVDDLNQVETYVTIAEKYYQFRSYEAYLVGSRLSDELERRLKHRSSSFKVLTYSELIDQTKQRYKEFLDSLESSK
jgi:ribosomal protein L40E